MPAWTSQREAATFEGVRPRTVARGCVGGSLVADEKQGLNLKGSAVSARPRAALRTTRITRITHKSPVQAVRNAESRGHSRISRRGRTGVAPALCQRGEGPGKIVQSPAGS